MFGRPRCREWTPLATQQLRLRSLIQIVGYNIRPPETNNTIDGFYYTLHATTMSSPFYTSEIILSPHPKWKEIDTDVVQKMSSTNVIIRLWCHLVKKPDQHVNDITVETWGVYLTGLRLIGTNSALDFTAEKFKTNTLVFQMPGGYFCSYMSLKVDVNLPEPHEKNSYSSSSSSGLTSCLKIPMRKVASASRSLSPSTKDMIMREDLLCKSNSPPAFKQSFAVTKDINMRSRCVDEDSRRIFYEQSPDSDVKVLAVSESTLNSTETLSASKNDLEYDDIPWLRYSCMKFLNSEIRPSYNADKLQRLHLLQYSIKNRKDCVSVIRDEIYKKSAIKCDLSGFSDEDLAVNLNRLRCKVARNLFDMDQCVFSDVIEGKVTGDSPANGQRFSLKLKDLLSYKSKPSPLERSEHARLTRQLEILRFKKAILADERDSKLASIRRLKEVRSRLLEENQDLGLELLHCYHSLSRISESEKLDLSELAGRYEDLKQALHSQRLATIKQLQYIFPIKKIQTKEPGLKWCSRYEWIAVCACAYILNAPLRYPIRPHPFAVYDTHQDQTLVLHNRVSEQIGSRGSALIARSAAQLAWHAGAETDYELVRGLVPALYALLNVSSQCNIPTATTACARKCRAACNGNDRVRARPFNRFKEYSSDYCRSQNSSCASSIASKDTDSLIISPAQLLGSEPYKTTECSLKAHGSDSKLNVLLAEEHQNKVVFTLGDGEVLKNIGAKCLSDNELCVSGNKDEDCDERV